MKTQEIKPGTLIIAGKSDTTLPPLYWIELIHETFSNVIQEARIEVNKKPWNIFQCSTVLIANCHNWYTCFSMFNGYFLVSKKKRNKVCFEEDSGVSSDYSRFREDIAIRTLPYVRGRLLSCSLGSIWHSWLKKSLKSAFISPRSAFRVHTYWNFDRVRFHILQIDFFRPEINDVIFL